MILILDCLWHIELDDTYFCISWAMLDQYTCSLLCSFDTCNMPTHPYYFVLRTLCCLSVTSKKRVLCGKLPCVRCLRQLTGLIRSDGPTLIKTIDAKRQSSLIYTEKIMLLAATTAMVRLPAYWVQWVQGCGNTVKYPVLLLIFICVCHREIHLWVVQHTFIDILSWFIQTLISTNLNNDLPMPRL